MGEPLPVSIVVIARNEEARIGRCLASAADLAREIVVLVNDCTDRTVEIAESFGARVFVDRWHGFRDQKNLALQYATEPWILSLDCDEELTDELRSSLVAFFRDGDHERFDGARFARRVWFMGRWIMHGDYYPDWSLRLFRRGKRFEGSAAHDKIRPSGPVRTLAGPMNHYSCPNIAAQIDKFNVFADAFVQEYGAGERRWSLLQTLFRPSWRFVRAYVLRRGFLDGFAGFHIACLNAFGAYVRYARLYEQERYPATVSAEPISPTASERIAA